MQQPSTPAALPGAVQALQPSALARRGFTQTDQVNQLVAASETDPDLGFMGRMMALCSLPRSNPGNRLQYKRVNDSLHAHHYSDRKLQAPLRHPAAPVDGLGLDRSGGTSPVVGAGFCYCLCWVST